MKSGIVNHRAGIPAPSEIREPLNAAWAAVKRAEADRAHAVIAAILAGQSQRAVAAKSGLAVNTVRAIIRDAGIVFRGYRYEVAGFVPEGSTE